jgi:hypothetical protein
MKAVRYGGREHLLSAWNYTNNQRMAQRSWLCPGGKVSAVTIVKRSGNWAFTVHFPDGELMDVGVCKTRGLCKTLVSRLLDGFLADCGITVRGYSKGFKAWLGLSHQASGRRGSMM